MTHAPLTVEEVLATTDALVAAFAATDTDAYFNHFAEDATFVFHSEPSRLDDRASYERVWRAWLVEGWHVVSCESSARLVQVLESSAVLSHSVRTVTAVGEVETTTFERESIVYVRSADSIVAVHEHLSSAPTQESR